MAARVYMCVALARCAAAVPSLEALRVDWVNMPLRQMPVVTNFFGAVTLRRDVVAGGGLIGLGPMTLSPYLANFLNSSIAFDGHSLRVENASWAWCEGTRSAARGAARVVNRVRAPFEQHAALQTWTVEGASAVDAWLDGPMVRRCDLAGDAASGACGWGETLPVNRSDFARSVDDGVALSEDTRTPAAAATVVAVAGCATATASVAVAGGGFRVAIRAPASCPTFEVRLATAFGASGAEAAALVRGLSGAAFDASWSGACERFDDRWRGAFDDSRPHFSGRLPALHTDEPAVDRLFHWAALALVGMERTQYAGPRTFVISEGPTNSFDGSANMGGSGQFLWDLSFSIASMTLLEPKSTRTFVDFVVRASNVSSKPMAVPQTWDAYTMAPPGPGAYCFDYVSAFLSVSQYALLEGGYDYLTTPVANVTPVAYLRALAWSWTAYNASSVSPYPPPPGVFTSVPRRPRPRAGRYLRDYGRSKRLFLEAVPTYRDVVPALQLSNAGMLLSLARLLDVFPELAESADEAAVARSNATAIVAAALEHAYVDGAGFWKCLDQNGTAGASVGVRAIADFLYGAFGVGLVGRDPDLLPARVRGEMAAFFDRELLANGWVRALSLSDPVMADIDAADPSVEAKLAFRPDWTGTGGYGGLAGFAVDALADLTQDLAAPLAALRNFTLAATTSTPAQGIAVTTPPYVARVLDGNDGLPAPDAPYGPAFPEWFDQKQEWEPPLWPNTERTLSTPPASLCDAVLRTVFGWRPGWDFLRDTDDAAAAVDRALFLPTTPRPGFRGTLAGVRTPRGAIDITASDAGLDWAWAAHGDGA